MKFGKTIQKRQLEIPEYAASFVDYKALKKLIKRLSATPVITAQVQEQASQPAANAAHDPQATLQANKGAFFFRLERELDKVNSFYLQKEAELKLRLETLLERKTALYKQPAPAAAQNHSAHNSSSAFSTVYAGLEEGLRIFNSDLDKIQQFIQINQTAFAKILKKWDRSSKSRTKELYLSRAVEVQPCFDRDVISDLSDKATTSLLEIGAWAEGERLEFAPSQANQSDQIGQFQQAAPKDTDSRMLAAIVAGDALLVQEWLQTLSQTQQSRDHVSRLFLSSINTAPLQCQNLLVASGWLDSDYRDDINQRSCLHELAISGRVDAFLALPKSAVDIRSRDVYGRTPLHYASMYGHGEIVEALLTSEAADRLLDGTDIGLIDCMDVDHFTPLVLAIVHKQSEPARLLLEHGARIEPRHETDHIPLNLACQHGNVRIVELLLLRKPRILADAEGLYPQHLVPRSHADPAILLLLAEYGASLDQPDKLYQWTPIFHAASEGHLPCLRTLVECRVDVWAVDEKGLSSIYYAAWEGHKECLQVLKKALSAIPQSQHVSNSVTHSLVGKTPNPKPPTQAPESIPDLSLPPPIIPLRRYGHNFLDTTKTFIVITFDTSNDDAIKFYGDTKYPAARLAISSKSSDLIPRNITLPMQDEHRIISFQIENLETFSMDFDIYPTFGSKVIARGAASSSVFTSRKSSSGYWHLEVFDPRLRAVGRICFDYQVVTPFRDIPMETTQFATYWKATSQVPSNDSSGALITGSSLAGDYVRICVQTTKDMVPVLHSHWAVQSDLDQLGICNNLIQRLTYDQLTRLIDHNRIKNGTESPQRVLSRVIEQRGSLLSIANVLSRSGLALKDILAQLPIETHLNIHVVYPSRFEEDEGQLGPTANMNAAIDAVLSVVFQHASAARASVAGGGPIRSVVFSSPNPMICTALNWKQPNCKSMCIILCVFRIRLKSGG